MTSHAFICTGEKMSNEKVKITDKDGRIYEINREDFAQAMLKEAESNKENGEQLFYIGHALISEEFYEEAIEVFSMARDTDPENMTYDNAIGVCYLQMGHYEDAKEFYKQHVNKFPKSALGYLNIAKAFDYLHQDDGLVENLKKSLELNPNFYNSLLYWLLYCKENNIVKEGIQFLLDLAAKGENVWGPYLILALEYEENRDDAAALEYADKALSRKIDNGCAFADLAALYSKMGKFEKSIEIMEQRAKTEELGFKEFWNLAVAYFEAGQIEKAKVAVVKLEEMAHDSESQAYIQSLKKFWLQEKIDVD